MKTLDSVVVGLGKTDQEVLVVLDGLDEYPSEYEQYTSEQQQRSTRDDVLHWLRQFPEKHPNAHILVLSRDENDIRRFFHEAMQVDVAECVNGDLHLFVQSRINGIVEKDHWKNEFKAQLLSRIQGVGEK